jgi:hypothetical protein
MSHPATTEPIQMVVTGSVPAVIGSACPMRSDSVCRPDLPPELAVARTSVGQHPAWDRVVSTAAECGFCRTFGGGWIPGLHSVGWGCRHNGSIEGVNTKTKLFKRQMYGRASFALLRHRILPG